jgi:hypothetical protein
MLEAFITPGLLMSTTGGEAGQPFRRRVFLLFSKNSLFQRANRLFFVSKSPVLS